MRYEVSERFYTNLVGLLGVALEDNSNLEIDLVLGLIRDTANGQDDYGVKRSIRVN
jgi:hypothetical protein